MNEKMLNQNFLNVLSEVFPKKKILVNEIANTLDLDKISIYRRLNGFTSFKTDEIGILAKKYNISLDKALNMHSPNSMEMNLDIFHTIEDIDYEVLEKQLSFLEQLASQPDSEMGGVFYTYPITLFSPYEHLLKYHWFVWKHYYDQKSINQRYESIEIPSKLMEYNHIGYEMYKNIKYTYYIWKTDLTSRLIKDLKYFESIHLISPESIRQIKDELYQGLDRMEEKTNDGKISKKGNKFEIYLCDLNVNKTELYMWSEKMSSYTIPIFGPHRINSTDKEACTVARRWIQRMRGASILISESAEKEKIQFFKKQREELKEL
ncbi:hypothetical protein M2459_000429 [Parabacteroides sp. PF5-5]|uniref:hypothetical protein n=1 Tax=unclassified Parabacteroides TaxID=2649774 RepID=UPI002474CDED|nr:MULTISPECIES: hypothetical protein [unclassified Parabacteroides]MDH6303637.1 hypothetical protein [Parabacteroides sp. PH5-39]MDH6314959.1 hypothetical protein [Parabacteroides sp. PF5-13]MDH6318296.1 hypothetical protein [Parabacteroides sp. PH5-13]MDH6321771.1 hypothetical protein [Parabacteroides sp. PH5-8]MDH6325895.1 hypothetical protein [Parabacteroides sp. PH5-41]